jgi:S1-C subfamily serine protease
LLLVDWGGHGDQGQQQANNGGGGGNNPPLVGQGDPEHPFQPASDIPGGKLRMPGAEVYKKILPSTVWIKLHTFSAGTGSLVDAENHLVITNAHVVPMDAPATVHFPRFEDGKLVAEKEYYDRFPQHTASGVLVYKDTQRDLAILKLDKLPPGAKAITLSKNSASPGETVHAIGNPGASGALWVYSSGTVRQVYQKRWTSSSPNGGPVYNLLAHVLETQVPANPGDSGGPVVNGYGEQVGVTQGFSAGAQLFSNAIDISEVHFVLNAYKKDKLGK